MNESRQPGIFDRFLANLAEIEQGNYPAMFSTQADRVYDDDSPEPASIAIAMQRIADNSRPAYFPPC